MLFAALDKAEPLILTVACQKSDRDFDLDPNFDFDIGPDLKAS